jgi:predicted phage baseplate assembly protein
VLARAITAGDYAHLAEQHPAVQRAAAELRWNGSWYEVGVAVDPFGQAEAPAGLLGEIERHLYRYRRIGHDVAVRLAQYVALDLVLEVCVKRSFLRGHVKADLLERFSTRRLPDGSLGFFHPDALSFGQGISLSQIVAAAQTTPGIESVTVVKLERLFEGPRGEIEAGVLPIGPLEIARLDNDPNFPENGRIRFEMRGGR